MTSPSEAITAYILAKDCNRPWMMQEAFAKDARLEMVVRTKAISFPPEVFGRDAISDVLVRQFAIENENVYTFCLATAPGELDRDFSCDWLVGMSRRERGELRVGCGRYDWAFQVQPELRVSNLRITVEKMEVLASTHTDAVLGWLASLSYPWCPSRVAIRGMPSLDELAPISEFLGSRSRGS